MLQVPVAAYLHVASVAANVERLLDWTRVEKGLGQDEKPFAQ